MIQAAKFYRDKLGFSIIPISPTTKKPLIKWKQYQQTRPTDEEMEAWWVQYPSAKLGIVTGKISNIAVVDIDTQEGYKAIEPYIPPTLPAPRVKTPSGGQHIYFRYPSKPVRNNARLIEGCDLRAEGGYVVAPPSQGYVWLDKKALKHFPVLPDDYLRVLSKSTEIDLQFDRELFNKGTRDQDLFHVANCLLRGGMSLKNTLQIVAILALNCNPPCSVEKAKMKVKSAWERRKR